LEILITTRRTTLMSSRDPFPVQKSSHNKIMEVGADQDSVAHDWPNHISAGRRPHSSGPGQTHQTSCGAFGQIKTEGSMLVQFTKQTLVFHLSYEAYVNSLEILITTRRTTLMSSRDPFPVQKAAITKLWRWGQIKIQ